MKYRGKDIEIIGEKTVFGQHTAWIHLLEDDTFQQVLWDDISFYDEKEGNLSQVRYVALAARITSDRRKPISYLSKGEYFIKSYIIRILIVPNSIQLKMQQEATTSCFL